MARRLILLLLIPAVLGAQPSSSEYELKAVFLFNFLKYVTWPESAASGPLQVCVAGHNPFGTALDATFEDETINERPVVSRVITSPAPDCHVVFIPRTANARAYLNAARGTTQLLIGESPDFIEQGGIINFVTDPARRLRFEISPEAAMLARLEISSDLLRLRYTQASRGGK